MQKVIIREFQFSLYNGFSNVFLGTDRVAYENIRYVNCTFSLSGTYSFYDYRWENLLIKLAFVKCNLFNDCFFHYLLVVLLL